MCGRYAVAKDPARLVVEFDAVDDTEGRISKPDYNVAPTKLVAAVVQRHPRDADGTPDPNTTVRSLRAMKWGLVPKWAKDPGIGARMINARSESAAEKPAFRTSLARYRCLMPADGWYEWQRDGERKQPYYMTNLDGSSLAMAGLWSTWRRPDAPDEPPLITCSVLTTDAIGPLAQIHERMPLLLPKEAWAAWLDPDSTDVAELLAPPSAQLLDALELRPVSTSVNSVRNNDPALTERVAVPVGAPEPEPQALFELP